MLPKKENNFTKLSALQGPFRRSYCGNRTDYVDTYGCLYKKSVFTEVGGFDPGMGYGEDMELSGRVMNKGYCFHFINEPLIGMAFRSTLRKYTSNQIKKVAHAVICYLRPKGTKITGGATGPTDYAQSLIPVAFLIAAFPLAFLLQAWLVAVALAMALLLLLTLNISFIRFVFNNRGSAKLSRYWQFSLLFYLIVRCLSWTCGLIYGMWLLLSHPSLMRYPGGETKGS